MRELFEGVFECHERRGEFMRKVIEVKPSPLIEKYLSARMPLEASPMKTVSYIYSLGVRLFLVDDIGMMMKGPLELNNWCDVHICFWDRILYGREYMANSMAKMVAVEAGKVGVWTAIPVEARATLAFARRVGFEEFHRNDSISALVMLVT